MPVNGFGTMGRPKKKDLEFGLKRAILNLKVLETDVKQLKAAREVKLSEVDKLDLEMDKRRIEMEETQAAIEELKEQIGG